MILTLIAVLGFLFLTLNFLSGRTSVDDYATQTATSQIPDIFNVIIGIVSVFGGGLIAAVLILIVVFGWQKIENFDVLPFLEDGFDFFNDLFSNESYAY